LQSDATVRLIQQRVRHRLSPSARGTEDHETDSFGNVREGTRRSKRSLREQLGDASPDGKPKSGLHQQVQAPTRRRPFDSDGDDDYLHGESFLPLKSGSGSGVISPMSSREGRDTMREFWALEGKRTSTRIRADSDSSPLPCVSPPIRPGSIDSLSSDDRIGTEADTRHYLSVNSKRILTRMRTDCESSPLPSMIPPTRKGSFNAAAENHNDEVSLSCEENEDFPENDVAAPDSKKQRSESEYRADDQWSDEDVDIREEEGGKRRKGKLRIAVTALVAVGAMGYVASRALAQDDDLDDGGGVYDFQDAVQFDASQSVQVAPAPDVSQAAQAIPVDVSQVAQVAPIPAPPAPPVPTISPGELQVMQQMATQAASNAAIAASAVASAASIAAGAGAAIAGAAA
jgi:hypothetical protein